MQISPSSLKQASPEPPPREPPSQPTLHRALTPSPQPVIDNHKHKPPQLDIVQPVSRSDVPEVSSRSLSEPPNNARGVGSSPTSSPNQGRSGGRPLSNGTYCIVNVATKAVLSFPDSSNVMETDLSLRCDPSTSHTRVCVVESCHLSGSKVQNTECANLSTVGHLYY